MSFAIEFLDESPFTDDLTDARMRRGHVILGSDIEIFRAPLIYWDEQRYARQWRDALTVVLGEQAPGVLLTSAWPPSSGALDSVWPCWREGEVVYFQELLVRFADESVGASADELVRVDPDRDTPLGPRSDDASVSQWSVPAEEVADFVQNQ